MQSLPSPIFPTSSLELKTESSQELPPPPEPSDSTLLSLMVRPKEVRKLSSVSQWAPTLPDQPSKTKKLLSWLSPPLLIAGSTESMTRSQFSLDLKEEKHPSCGVSETSPRDSMEMAVVRSKDPSKKPDFILSLLNAETQWDKKPSATTPLTSNQDPSSEVRLYLFSQQHHWCSWQKCWCRIWHRSSWGPTNRCWQSCHPRHRSCCLSQGHYQGCSECSS